MGLQLDGSTQALGLTTEGQQIEVSLRRRLSKVQSFQIRLNEKRREALQWPV